MGLIKDQDDIIVTINHGIDEYDISFIQQIEKDIGEVLIPLGFTQGSSSKTEDQCKLVYYQFAWCNKDAS